MNEMSNIIESLDALLQTGEFWVLVSFIGLLAIAFYYRAPGQLAKALDQRAQMISRDLDEAKRLYDEAQALLEKHEARLAGLGAEADQIMGAARKLAKDYSEEHAASLNERIQRQEKQAEMRIDSARKTAISSLHHEAAMLSVRAAKLLIDEKADHTALIDRGLDEIETALVEGALVEGALKTEKRSSAQ